MSLHPQAQQLLASFEGMPPLAEGTLEQARAMTGGLKAMQGDGPEIGGRRELDVPTGDGSVPMLVIDPPDAVRGLFFYVHGGGWISGSPADFEPLYRRLAVATGCRVAAPDYRLAPEAPFPTGLDDAWQALVWAARNLSEDKTPVIVGGDSSGGNMAAVLAQRARDRNGPPIAMQVLIYPVTDADFNTPSYIEHGSSGLLVGRAEMEWYWNHYIPDPDGRSHPEVSPLRAESLAGLPPAYVLLAEYDPMRDEGQAFADRLADDGVKVSVDYVDDQFHGFFTMVAIMDSADAAVARVAEAVSAQITRGRA